MPMTMHWKSVLPVDRYIVRLNGFLHENDRKVMTLLYQPLMGAPAHSLYMTLWSEVEEDRFFGKPSTHHGLMTMMQMSLKQIFEERKKLEGLALLNTYVKESKEGRTFLYELQPPLTPADFFQNDVLGTYLYNRIGGQKFAALKKRFTYPSVNSSEYRPVTASFDEVFTSVQHSELIPKKETEAALQPREGYEWASRESSTDVAISDEQFDFDLFMTHLSGLIVPEEALTEDIREVIKKLAFVYDIEPLEMSKRLERAYVNRGGNLEAEAIRKEIQDWYAFEHDHEWPSLSLRTQPLQYQTMAHREPRNEEEKIIRAFETYSPSELLKQIGGGAKPALADLKVVESIMIEQKLPPGVVNVLIDYVTTTNDMKFVRSHVEKIAGHWARKNIKTAAEAMNLARKEHQKYQHWAQPKSNRTKQAKSKPRRREPLPKWMTEKVAQSEPDPGLDDLRKQLEKKLKDS